LKSDNALVFYNLGTCLQQKGQLDEAIRRYREAIRLKPDFAEAYTNLGVCLHGKGQLDEAIRRFREAIRLKPDLTNAYTNLGNCLREKGQLAEAAQVHGLWIALLEKLVKAFPANEKHRYNLAGCYHNLSNLLRDWSGAPAEQTEAVHRQTCALWEKLV